MRDDHILTSRKCRIDIDDALRIIRERYPNASQEGSVCSYHWFVDDIIVGEAWIHKDRRHWWFRIKDA